MRKIDLLISQSRRATDNVDYSDTNGISQEEFLQYANDAQDQMQSVISVQFPDVFQVEKEIDAVSGQEEYSIPDDAYLGNRIDLVEYSPDRSALGFYLVTKGNKRERLSGLNSTPSFYIRRSGSVLFEPAPQQTGIIRFLYQKTLPRLDTSRGVVLSVSLATDSITSLTLDPAQLIDDTALLEEGYITVVNSDGEIQMRRIPVTAIDTVTGIVTIGAGFTFETGETISAGDYVLRGKESTTHSQLPDVCERYLVSYMNWKILKRDSSNDSTEAQVELATMLTEIIDSFKEPDGDINLIPILDGTFLTED